MNPTKDCSTKARDTVSNPSRAFGDQVQVSWGPVRGPAGSRSFDCRSDNDKCRAVLPQHRPFQGSDGHALDLGLFFPTGLESASQVSSNSIRTAASYPDRRD
jgi:hypothetical protein